MFINRDDLDFGTVGDLPPTQRWDLGENLRGEIELPTQVSTILPTQSLLPHFTAQVQIPALFMISSRVCL